MNPLSQVGSGFNEKSTGSGRPNINGSDQILILATGKIYQRCSSLKKLNAQNNGKHILPMHKAYNYVQGPWEEIRKYLVKELLLYSFLSELFMNPSVSRRSVVCEPMQNKCRTLIYIYLFIILYFN